MFTRTKHRADRLAKHLEQHKVSVQRIHGNRSQSQRTEALAGFKSGKYRVLVATDIAARGIDVTALGHVINFDVPAQPEDYIHRVGRTARAELTGSAFTLVAPEDEASVRDIEKAINKRLPRVTVPDFDYAARAEQRLEMPHAQRIAEIRARKADERQRARANTERRARHGGQAQPAGQGQGSLRVRGRVLGLPGRGRTAQAREKRFGLAGLAGRDGPRELEDWKIGRLEDSNSQAVICQSANLPNTHFRIFLLDNDRAVRRWVNDLEVLRNLEQLR